MLSKRSPALVNIYLSGKHSLASVAQANVSTQLKYQRTEGKVERHILQHIEWGKITLFVDELESATTQKVAQTLEDHKLLFKIVQLPSYDKLNAMEAMAQYTSSQTFPIVFFGRECIGGCKDLERLAKGEKLIDLAKQYRIKE